MGHNQVTVLGFHWDSFNIFFLIVYFSANILEMLIFSCREPSKSVSYLGTFSTIVPEIAYSLYKHSKVKGKLG